MRQNERIEFTRVGDTSRTTGWLKGEPTLLWACSQFLYLQDKENSFGDGGVRPLVRGLFVPTLPNMVMPSVRDRMAHNIQDGS